MKTLISVLILVLLSQIAQARSLVPPQTIVTMDTTVTVNVGEFDQQKPATIEVSNYGEVILKVYKTRRMELPDFKGFEKIKSYLNPKERSQVFQAAAKLSDADLYRKDFSVICAMMPPFGGFFRGMLVKTQYSGEGYFYGKLRQVLSPRGCWVGYVVHPEDQKLNDLAQKLFSFLEKVANEIVSGKRPLQRM